MAVNYQLNTTASGGTVSDKWRRTRGHNNENVAGSIEIAKFTEFAVDGVIPSGIAVTADEETKTYIPYVEGASLDGFISDMTGVPVVAGQTTAVISVAIRETIVPKYLPVAAQRTISAATPTTGDFVFIKE